jgi:hypothetical protein
MEDKIRIDEIKRYGREYAQIVCQSFFQNKEKISGQEILTFSPVRQVNLLILFELLKSWASEIEKLKSPYFDYTTKPVQDALLQFQNTLSNHIAISKSNFVPLVEQAVYRTISLIISPYDFYSSILDNKGKGIIMMGELRNEIKYLKINSAPLEKLLAKLAEDKKYEDTVSGKEAFALLDGILEEVNFSPEDPEIYLTEFSKTRKVALADFYEPMVQPAPAPKKVIAAPPTRKPTVATVQTTLYDQLSQSEPRATLADNFQRRKIAKLRDSLSINQKFMFTKMLFNGDFEIFSQTIERLDMLDNLSQALNFFQNDFPEWDRESEECQEFMAMVEKRFSEE